MDVANLVSGLNWMYPKNELMKATDFLHAGTNSRKVKDDWKFLGEHV